VLEPPTPLLYDWIIREMSVCLQPLGFSQVSFVILAFFRRMEIVNGRKLGRCIERKCWGQWRTLTFLLWKVIDVEYEIS
jgi:hypothetical protein